MPDIALTPATEPGYDEAMPKKSAPAKRGRGRPPVNPPDMTERFMIRATPADLEHWKRLAAEDGLNVGPWIRMLVSREVRKREK